MTKEEKTEFDKALEEFDKPVEGFTMNQRVAALEIVVADNHKALGLVLKTIEVINMSLTRITQRLQELDEPRFIEPTVDIEGLN